MKAQWLTRIGTPDLVLVFGGWALGAAPFAGLTGDTDVLLVDSYTDLDTPLPELAAYDQISLLAFSFGVASAGHWLAHSGVKPARLVAVSGTLYPADTTRGIAPEMIQATADGLQDTSFAKFCRRAGLTAPAPALDIPAARDELHAIAERGPAPACNFDRIWIPSRDRIIPTQAQVAAWADQPDRIRRIPGNHVPFAAGQSWQEWLT